MCEGQLEFSHGGKVVNGKVKNHKAFTFLIQSDLQSLLTVPLEQLRGGGGILWS